MPRPLETVVEEVTLDVVERALVDIGQHNFNNILEDGVEMLVVSLRGGSYRVSVDRGMVSFILEVPAPLAGNFDLACEWNMFETVGTAICLSKGYALKYVVLVRGGIVYGTLTHAIRSFAECSVKFIEKAQAPQE